MVWTKAESNKIERTTEALLDDLCSERQRNVMGSEAWSTKQYVTARLNGRYLGAPHHRLHTIFRPKRFFDRGGAGENWSI
jgi:hypothetical protein